MQSFFTYIAKSNLRERIVFEDHYRASSVPKLSEPVQIIDPINASNNVARMYTDSNADAIVDAALEAGEAIDAALAAPNKELTLRYWQKVFGPSFQG